MKLNILSQMLGNMPTDVKIRKLPSSSADLSHSRDIDDQESPIEEHEKQKVDEAVPRNIRKISLSLSESIIAGALAQASADDIKSDEDTIESDSEPPKATDHLPDKIISTSHKASSLESLRTNSVESLYESRVVSLSRIPISPAMREKKAFTGNTSRDSADSDGSRRSAHSALASREGLLEKQLKEQHEDIKTLLASVEHFEMENKKLKNEMKQTGDAKKQ